MQQPDTRDAVTSARRIIRIEPSQESFSCLDSESLLLGLARQGVRVIPVGCVSGGCGVCRVQIVSGEFETGTMSRAHVSEEEQRLGIALACKVYPRSDLVLRVLGKKVS
jgi:ferredoxin